MRFQVADFSQMTTNFYPTLTDNTLDTPINHAGCNDIPDRNISPRKVAVKAAIWSLEEQWIIEVLFSFYLLQVEKTDITIWIK